MTGNEVEIIEGMKSYWFQILGISEVKKKGSGIVLLADNYKLIYSGVPKGLKRKLALSWHRSCLQRSRNGSQFHRESL